MVFGRHNNTTNTSNTADTANTGLYDGTSTQQHVGIGQKIQNVLHRGNHDSATTTAPAPTLNTAPAIDTSLRSTNVPIHTNPGTVQGLGLNQGLTQPGLAQGGLTQGGFTQTGLTQGGFNQGGFNQGGFNQGGFTQTGLTQGGFTQGGLAQPGLVQIQTELKQAVGQNHLFLQGPGATLLQQNVAPMHTAPGAHSTFLHTAPTGLAGAAQPQGIAHQPLLVNKKLRSTITDTTLAQPLVQQQQVFAAPLQQQQVFAAPLQQQRQFIPTETHYRPTIVEEVQRAERLVEVQPIIHREVEAPEVRIIEQHIYETVPSTGPAFINKPAIVEETIRPRIIEEVHPVIHREVPQPFIERVEQHISERVVQPTTMTKEVINDARQQFVPAGGFVAAGGPALQPASSIPAHNISSSTLRR